MVRSSRREKNALHIHNSSSPRFVEQFRMRCSDEIAPEFWSHFNSGMVSCSVFSYGARYALC